jgi:hypothetical protein
MGFCLRFGDRADGPDFLGRQTPQRTMVGGQRGAEAAAAAVIAMMCRFISSTSQSS